VREKGDQKGENHIVTVMTQWAEGRPGEENTVRNKKCVLRYRWRGERACPEGILTKLRVYQEKNSVWGGGGGARSCLPNA